LAQALCEAGKTDPKHFGCDGARSRFLKFSPNGFRWDGFSSQERDHKLAAKENWGPRHLSPRPWATMGVR